MGNHVPGAAEPVNRAEKGQASRCVCRVIRNEVIERPRRVAFRDKECFRDERGPGMACTIIHKWAFFSLIVALVALVALVGSIFTTAVDNTNSFYEFRMHMTLHYIAAQATIYKLVHSIPQPAVPPIREHTSQQPITLCRLPQRSSPQSNQHLSTQLR